MKKLILFTMVFTFLGTPARADLVLSYDMPEAVLDFTVSDNRLVAQDTSDSDLILKLLDDTTFATLDNAKVKGGDNFNLVVDLTMTDLPGANNWSAAGTLKFTDTFTGTNAVEAAVQAYSVSVSGDYLEIKGYLGDLNPPTILVNRGDPWVFVGNAQSLAGGDADATPNQITMYNPGSYDGGELLTLRFGIKSDLDTFFGADRLDLYGGEVKGQVVPAPAAVLLGMLGLSVAGIKLRKYA